MVSNIGKKIKKQQITLTEDIIIMTLLIIINDCHLKVGTKSRKSEDPRLKTEDRSPEAEHIDFTK
jgi:hypothetical protein